MSAQKKKTRPSVKMKDLQDNKKSKSKTIFSVIMMIFSVYAAYAYSTPMPMFMDKVIGKTIMSFLFGKVSVFVCVYLFILGLMICLNKLKNYQQTLGMCALILWDFMMIVSTGTNNIMTYSIAELFSATILGGICGGLPVYLIMTVIGKVGTYFLTIFLLIIELVLLFKLIFSNTYDKIKKKNFGLDALKQKADSIKKQKELYEQTKQAEAKRSFDNNDLVDNDFDDLFGRKEQSEISVDTEYLSVGDIMDQLDQEKAKKKNISNKHKHDELASIKTEVVPEELIPTVLSEEMTEEYDIPDISLLNPTVHNGKSKKQDVAKKAQIIDETLKSFGVAAKIVGVDVGPSITRFEVQPDSGVKVNKIVSLSDDLALNLATSDIRMEAPIPGKSAIGIEVPNSESELVGLREIIESGAFMRSKGVLPFALGKTLTGQNIIGDISKMPHLLIAGATGSGKSVCINTIIISLLYKCSPEDLRMILIDPKMVELNQYNHIPHLLIPVVTDPKKAASALGWGIKEMTDRYALFKENSVRDIVGYNKKVSEFGGQKLPRIVIVIDELADLMMTSPKEIESSICRIAQLARACGIHLVIATQRPSVDIITGLIKANIPSRIAFAVASNTDSRTILDMGGAEKLLGKGDMLYFPVGKSKPLRLQGTFVSDEEINRVISAVEKDMKPQFNLQIEDVISQYENQSQLNETEESEDSLFPKAVELAFTYNQISTSMIQRKLKVGYARAGRIIDELEQAGVISGPNGSKPRTVIITREEFYHG